MGEFKWGTDRVDRRVVRELVVNQTPLVLEDLPDGGEGWHVHYGLFRRSGFTPAAQAEMEKVEGILVDLQAIDGVLGYD